MKYDRGKGGNKGMKENRDGKHKCRVKKEFWKSSVESTREKESAVSNLMMWNQTCLKL